MAEVFSHVLAWKSACLEGGARAGWCGQGEGVPRLDPLVFPPFSSISLGTAGVSLCLSISGNAGISARLG